MFNGINVRSVFFRPARNILIITLSALVGFYAIRWLEKAQRMQIVDSNREVAQSISQEAGRFITQKLDVLQSLGVVLSDEGVSIELRKRLFALALHQNDYFLTVFAVDRNGLELFREDARAAFLTDLPRHNTKADFLTVKERGFYLSPVSVVEGRAFFSIGRAVKDDQGRFLGGIFARVDARVLHDIISQSSQEADSHTVYLVDQGSIVISHPDLSYVLREKSFAAFPAVRSQVYREDHDPLTSYVGYNGQSVLGVGAPVAFRASGLSESIDLSTKWFVIVEREVLPPALPGWFRQWVFWGVGLIWFFSFLSLGFSIRRARRMRSVS